MAEGLLFSLHGELLRALSLHLDVHFEGLQQAARVAKSRRIIDSSLAKKCHNLDTCVNFLKHVTEPLTIKIRKELETQLSKSQPRTSSLSASSVSTAVMETKSCATDTGAVHSAGSGDTSEHISAGILKSPYACSNHYIGDLDDWLNEVPQVAHSQTQTSLSFPCADIEVKLLEPTASMFVEQVSPVTMEKEVQTTNVPQRVPWTDCSVFHVPGEVANESIDLIAESDVESDLGTRHLVVLDAAAEAPSSSSATSSVVSQCIESTFEQPGAMASNAYVSFVGLLVAFDSVLKAVPSGTLKARKDTLHQTFCNQAIEVAVQEMVSIAEFIGGTANAPCMHRKWARDVVTIFRS